jgi:hypothetical protein
MRLIKAGIITMYSSIALVLLPIVLTLAHGVANEFTEFWTVSAIYLWFLIPAIPFGLLTAGVGLSLYLIGKAQLKRKSDLNN